VRAPGPRGQESATGPARRRARLLHEVGEELAGTLVEIALHQGVKVDLDALLEEFLELFERLDRPGAKRVERVDDVVAGVLLVGEIDQVSAVGLETFVEPGPHECFDVGPPGFGHGRSPLVWEWARERRPAPPSNICPQRGP